VVSRWGRSTTCWFSRTRRRSTDERPTCSEGSRISGFRVFVCDNYDSFTFNLVQYLGELGADVVVARNDEATLEDIAALGTDAVVISPGPGGPGGAGLSVPVVEWCARTRTPLL